MPEDEEPPSREELDRLRQQVEEVRDIVRGLANVVGEQAVGSERPRSRRESARKKARRRWFGTPVAIPIFALAGVWDLLRNSTAQKALAGAAAAATAGTALWLLPALHPDIGNADRQPVIISPGPTQPTSTEPGETPTASTTMDEGEVGDETAPESPSDTQAPGPQSETQPVAEPEPPEDSDESPVDEVTPPDGGGEADDQAPEIGNGKPNCALLQLRADDLPEVCLENPL